MAGGCEKFLFGGKFKITMMCANDTIMLLSLVVCIFGTVSDGVIPGGVYCWHRLWWTPWCGQPVRSRGCRHLEGGIIPLFPIGWRTKTSPIVGLSPVSNDNLSKIRFEHLTRSVFCILNMYLITLLHLGLLNIDYLWSECNSETINNITVKMQVIVFCVFVLLTVVLKFLRFMNSIEPGDQLFEEETLWPCIKYRSPQAWMI